MRSLKYGFKKPIPFSKRAKVHPQMRTPYIFTTFAQAAPPPFSPSLHSNKFEGDRYSPESQTSKPQPPPPNRPRFTQRIGHLSAGSFQPINLPRNQKKIMQGWYMGQQGLRMQDTRVYYVHIKLQRYSDFFSVDFKKPQLFKMGTKCNHFG